MVKATEKFHYYLYGQRFVVRTDHASLKWLFNFRQPEGQIARWLQKLQEYDFEIVHRARSHVNADALSRRPCYESACKFCSALEDKGNESQKIRGREERSMLENGTSRGVTFEAQDELLFPIWTKEELRTKQLEDPHIKPLIEWNISGRPEWQEVSCMSPVTKSYWAQWGPIEMVDGILYRRWEDASGRDVKYLYLTPKAIRDDVLQNLHDSPTAGLWSEENVSPHSTAFLLDKLKMVS